MPWDSLPLLFVAALLLWVLYAFIREKWSPDVVAAIAVAALLISQLLTPGEVLSVLSNSARVLGKARRMRAFPKNAAFSF